MQFYFQIDSDDMVPLSKNTDSLEKPPPNLYDSDSDLSDTERLILERRRLNTEYMDQIERERQEVIQKTFVESKELLVMEKMKETAITEDENDVEMKEVMNKSLEELEAERDALLQQVRNPEPPSVTKISEAPKAPEFELPVRTKPHENIDRDNVETKKLKKGKRDINGDVLRLKTASESSTGESSPCSQVSVHFSTLF